MARQTYSDRGHVGAVFFWKVAWLLVILCVALVVVAVFLPLVA